jgi:hypothetical protein
MSAIDDEKDQVQYDQNQEQIVHAQVQCMKHMNFQQPIEEEDEVNHLSEAEVHHHHPDHHDNQDEESFEEIQVEERPQRSQQ